jgi:hypothetical protein
VLLVFSDLATHAKSNTSVIATAPGTSPKNLPVSLLEVTPETQSTNVPSSLTSPGVIGKLRPSKVTADDPCLKVLLSAMNKYEVGTIYSC